MPDSALTSILAAAAPASSSGDLLGAATNIFVIISVLVAIVATGWAFRTRRNAVEIQNYKALAESYEKVDAARKAENETLQAQIEELQHARAEDAEKIRHLQAKLDTLTDIVTGKTALDDLARKIDDLFQAITDGQSHILGQLDDLAKRATP